jgi:hypothetical protein
LWLFRHCDANPGAGVGVGVGVSDRSSAERLADFGAIDQW